MTMGMFLVLPFVVGPIVLVTLALAGIVLLAVLAALLYVFDIAMRVIK